MASPLAGQVLVSGTAQRLATDVAVTAFAIKAPAGNSHPVYVGPVGVTSSTGHCLDPGDDFQYERRQQSGLPAYQLSVSDFYAVGTPGDVVTWLASP